MAAPRTGAPFSNLLMFNSSPIRKKSNPKIYTQLGQTPGYYIQKSNYERGCPYSIHWTLASHNSMNFSKRPRRQWRRHSDSFPIFYLTVRLKCGALLETNISGPSVDFPSEVLLFPHHLPFRFLRRRNRFPDIRTSSQEFLENLTVNPSRRKRSGNGSVPFCPPVSIWLQK